MKPEQFNREKESFLNFRSRVQPTCIVDRYDLLLEDLFLIRNPRFKFVKDHKKELSIFSEEYIAGRVTEDIGEWFYFPWNKTLAHYLPSNEHQEIRTARNRNIITSDEQKKLYDIRVAYAGLSVGSHGALTFALMGGARKIKIADPDIVSASNLNRIRVDFLSLGRKKTDLVRDYIYQLNPYSDVESFDGGVDEENIDEFLSNVDVLVEETDNLEIKIRLRMAAREKRIPVIMATDNGDNLIIETERFDLDNTKKLFNGVIGDVDLETFKSFTPSDLPKLATKIAGPDLITERMMDSLLLVGREIYSWPQLGDAATLSGVAIAYILKRIALGENVVEEKVEINLDSILDPDYLSQDVKEARKKAREIFSKTIGLS